MTDAKKKQIMKVGGIVANVLIWIFVIFSLVVTVFVFATRESIDGVPAAFGKSFITIQSESMEDTYKKGDLVFMTVLSEDEKRELEPDTIITYRSPVDINGDGKDNDINTHRIVSHDKEGGFFITKGDNNEIEDTYKVYYLYVIGSCTEDGKIGGLGGVFDFLRSSLGFFLCIVLPLILFFLFELYNFISLLLKERAKKAPVSAELEEEIKRRAVEEYIKAQAEAASNASAEEEKTEEKTEENETTEEKQENNEE